MDLTKLINDVDSRPDADEKFAQTIAAITEETGNPPTHFQIAIYKWALYSTGHAVVDAKAGSGKTTTIVDMLKFIPCLSKVVLVAFNKHIAEELNARGLPSNATAKTLHSVGLSAFRRFQNRCKVTVNKTRYILADCMGGYNLMDDEEKKTYYKLAAPITRMVSLFKNFGYGALLPYPKKDEVLELAAKYSVELPDEMDTFLKMLADVFNKSIKQLNVLDFDDMLYLPIKLDLDFQHSDLVMVDESQDLNPIQIEIVKRMIGKNGRALFCGDEHQCLVENTPITLYNNMEIKINEDYKGGVIKCAAGNGTIAPNTVSEVTKTPVVDMPVYTIKTALGKNVTTTGSHIFFADFEETNMPKHHIIYLMEKIGVGFRVGTTQLHRAGKRPLVRGFLQRLNQERADKLWVIHTTDDKSEARYYEQYLSTKYGLPTWLFPDRASAYSTIQSKHVHKLFDEIDTQSGAKALLKDYGMFYQYPHHSPKCTTKKRRRNFNITMFADTRRKNSTLHSYSISGNDPEDAIKLADVGLSIRKSKNNGWRCENSCKSIADIHAILTKVEKVMPVNIIEKARLIKGRALPHCPAAHVRIGMNMFVEHEGEIIKDVVTNIEKSNYTGNVYDQDIPDYHNYIAGGIVSHNAIYGFRGADPKAIESIYDKFDATKLPLSISWRCPRTVIEEAQMLVPDIEAAPNAKPGIVRSTNLDTFRTEIQSGDYVLSRTTAPLVQECLKAIRTGKKAMVRGRDIGKGLLHMADNVEKQCGGTDVLDAIEAFSQVEIAKFAKPYQAAQLMVLTDKLDTLTVLACECNTFAEVKAAINKIFSDSDEGIVFSTIHRAKGLEAKRIFLFMAKLPHPLAQQEWQIQQEENLKYVAITRAMEELVKVDNSKNQ